MIFLQTHLGAMLSIFLNKYPSEVNTMARKLKQPNPSVYGASHPFDTPFPDPISSLRDPTTSDTGFDIGQAWINRTTNQAWIMTNPGVWALSSPGASDVDTINGLSPVAGNINIAGGTNLGVVNAGNTVTLNLDAAIDVATSVTSPLFTSGAGVDFTIEAPAGQDVIVQMGDNGGANKTSFTDSDGVEVFAIDSNGSIGTLAGLTVTGAFTQTAGAVSIAQDNAADAIDIGGGNVARAIGIGNSAAAHTITIGSTTGAASLDLQTGTGNFTLDGAAATTYTIGDSTVAGTVTIGGNAQTGNFVLAPSTGALTASFANLDGAKTIGIGNGVDGNAITMGNGANTSAQSVSISGGASAANSTVNILSGNVAAGVSTLNLATGTGGKTVHVADGAGVNLVTIGSTTGASSTTVQSGTAGVVVNASGAASPLTLDSVGVLELNSSAGVISIGNDAVAQNINVGTGAAARTITVGNNTGATSVVVDVGTGNLDLGVTATAHTTRLGSTNGASATTVQSGTGGIAIDATGAASTLNIDSVGQLQINSSASTIDIGNDAVAQNINIGTGAAARTIEIGNNTGASSVIVAVGTGPAAFGATATEHDTTIGSITGASSLTLQSGTGEITMTGTVKQIDAEFVTRSGVDVTFRSSPILQSTATTGAAPSGATGDTNIMMFQEGFVLEQFIKGAGQTIIAPRMGADGLLISLDQVATEGVEFNPGNRNNAPMTFTIGTDSAFFAECTYTVADVSGCEPMYFGFRKVQANDADYTNYTDFVGYGLNNLVAGGDAVIATNLNGAGINTTDTNDAWADAGTHTLTVNVSDAGVVTFLFDGVAPTATQAYTFDNGDVVEFWYTHVFGAALPGNINWVDFKCGYQP